ncbi:HNH endonuclease [uncultured Psychroserpens sp.]|uniref:HNH endonuclease n=1 Tax=uncultured Psychroserpens sp. TaxID=255436 RepID=UPI002628FABD|nr:HNH endonuclease [uncultured Psychroserpens sp.]
MKCYICTNEINDKNETDEHIIINAIGGRLKSKKLLCSECNSDFGENADSALAKQLNSLSNMLMVSRHRGAAQPIIGDDPKTGKKYYLEVGGEPKLFKPEITKKKNGDNEEISVTARTEKELRQILSGLAKKQPKFDLDEAMKSAEWQNKKLTEPLHFQNTIGGKDVFRAVTKTAMNYYMYCGGNRSQIEYLISYIKGETEQDIVWMHYVDSLYPLAEDKCYHILYLIGNPKERILYCYVEFFSTHKYLVLLNKEYDGRDLKQEYYFDITDVKEESLKIEMNYDRKTLLGFFKDKDDKLFSRVKEAFDHSIQLGLKRQDDNRRGNILERAIQNSLGKYPEGIPITEKMRKECVDEIVKDILPYLIDRMEK